MKNKNRTRNSQTQQNGTFQIRNLQLNPPPLLLGFMIVILTLLFITDNIFTNIETKYIEKLLHIGATEKC